MPHAHLLAILALIILALPVTPVSAQDRWAIGNGGWSSPGTWNGNTVPANTDNVFIGDNRGALTVLVSLSQNVTAGNVFLGYSGGSSGTLDLGNFNLTTGELYLGGGGVGSITRGTGKFTANSVYVQNGNTLSFTNGDTSSNLYLQNGATATTAAAGNVTANVNVHSGSTLTLGADLNVGGGIVDVQGTGSALNAQGNKITAGTLLVGWNGSGGGTLTNRGDLAVGNLLVANQNFNLTAADAVTTFHLSNGATALGTNAAVGNLYLQNGATATTAAAGNVTANVNVHSGSTLTLGAALNVGGGGIDIYGTGSALNAQGNKITAGSLLVGWNGSGGGTLTNRGDLAVGNLLVANQNLNLTPADAVSTYHLSAGATALGAGTAVSNLYLYNGATATTAAAGNVTANVGIYSGSTLTLGAALNVGGGGIDIYGTGSALNAQGNKITAGSLLVGWSAAGGTLANRGDLAVGNLYVANQNLNLTPADAVSTYHLSAGSTALGTGTAVSNLYLQNGATATTAAAGNVTANVGVYTGSTLTLGAALNVAGSVDVYGTNSVLNAQGNKITAGSLLVGWSAAGGTLANRGDLAVGNLYVGGQNLNLTAADAVGSFHLSGGLTALGTGTAVSNLYLQNGATATTAATGNVTANVNVYSGSTLTLGADLNVGGGIDIYGTNSVLNAQGHKITANTLTLGWYAAGGALTNRGALAVSNLYVGGQNLNLTAADAVGSFHLSGGSTAMGSGVSVSNLYLQNGATATTAATGNVTANVNVYSGSTLTLGADLNVGGGIDIYGTNSVLNAQGHKITANTLTLGWYAAGGALTNRGALAVSNLYVGGQNLNLTAADAVGSFHLSGGSTAMGSGVSVSNLYLQNGATATTAATGNVTANVNVYSGSTLTLGADLNVGGGIDIYGTNSVLNAQGHKITANTLTLGWYAAGGALTNRGALAVSNLYVGGQNLNLTAADAVGSFHLSGGSTAMGSGVSVSNLYLQNGATATTAATGNVTANVNVYSGSTLTLGADLNVAGSVDVYGTNSVLNAQGNKITAGSLLVGWSAAGGTLTNDGAVTVNNYYQATNTTLNGGNDTLGRINLSGTTVLRVTSGQATGLTLTDSDLGALSIADGSKLRLELNGNYSGWIFRWAGDHVTDLNDLIAAGKIDFVATNGGLRTITFDGNDNYTYVFQPVPEPHQVLLVAVAGLGGVHWLRRRRAVTVAA